MPMPVASRIRSVLPAALMLLLLDTPAIAQTANLIAPVPPAGLSSATRFEIRFLEGMIDHHAMAVQMSRMLQTQAIHPELRSLGDSIAAAQTDEIKQMQAWLQQWYGRTHEPPAMMADMQALDKLKGAAFEKQFLQMMIPHHSLAVRRAGECQRRGKHPELRQMCRNIVRSQQREIVTMKGWLCRWYHKCS